MKICMLTTSYPRFKGDYVGNFIHNMAKELVRQENEVHVVVPKDISTKRYELIDGVSIHRFQYWFDKKDQKVSYGDGLARNIHHSMLAKIQLPFFIFFFFRKAIKVGKKCDLIQCNWMLSGMVGNIMSKFISKPYIVVARGSDINYGMRNRYTKYIIKIILHNADKTFTVSDDLKKTILENIPSLKDKDIFLLSNGVDVSVFKPRDKNQIRKEIGLDCDDRIILYVGRLIKGKGVDYLIDGVKDILTKYNDIKLVLVGDGLEKKNLEKTTKQLGLNNKIFFVGEKPHHEIPLWLSSSDIFILPSLSEGRPNVVLEALSTGLPVITTNLNGTSEIIQNGQNGLLINPKSSEEIKEKIQMILNDKLLIKNLQSNARKSIFDMNLTWENTAKKIINDQKF